MEYVEYFRLGKTVYCRKEDIKDKDPVIFYLDGLKTRASGYQLKDYDDLSEGEMAVLQLRLYDEIRALLNEILKVKIVICPNSIKKVFDKSFTFCDNRVKMADEDAHHIKTVLENIEDVNFVKFNVTKNIPIYSSYVLCNGFYEEGIFISMDASLDLFTPNNIRDLFSLSPIGLKVYNKRGKEIDIKCLLNLEKYDEIKYALETQDVDTQREVFNKYLYEYEEKTEKLKLYQEIYNDLDMRIKAKKKHINK